ncbi:MAG: hypothetical protein WBD62_08745 [Anaerolineales bacterium]
MITLSFIQIKAKYRWIFGFLLLALYQVLLDRFWLTWVMSAVHYCPQGALSWGTLLIIASSLGDIFLDQKTGRRCFPWLSLAILILGSVLAFYLPISKHRASASYVLISLGLCGLIFFVFHILNARYQIRIPILTDFRKNPLLLYLLHGLILPLFVLPLYPGWYFESPLWIRFTQTAHPKFSLCSADGLKD